MTASPSTNLSEDIAGYWTLERGNSTGTYILTVLGIALMIISLIAWVKLESRRTSTPRRRYLRGGGMLPPASPTAPGPGFQEPPLARAFNRSRALERKPHVAREANRIPSGAEPGPLASPACGLSLRSSAS